MVIFHSYVTLPEGIYPVLKGLNTLYVFFGFNMSIQPIILPMGFTIVKKIEY
jgi:hypothetical protein